LQNNNSSILYSQIWGLFILISDHIFCEKRMDVKNFFKTLYKFSKTSILNVVKLICLIMLFYQIILSIDYRIVLSSILLMTNKYCLRLLYVRIVILWKKRSNHSLKLQISLIIKQSETFVIRAKNLSKYSIKQFNKILLSQLY